MSLMDNQGQSETEMSELSADLPRYSIIIVSYNCRGDLERCLDALKPMKQSDPRSIEIIVVDNASKDGTQEFLRSDSQIRSTLNSDNQGYSKACNQGAALAKGQFLIFLNPDTVPSTGFADTMAAYFRLPEVGAVGPLSNYVAGLQKYELHTTHRLPAIMGINDILSESEALAARLAADNQGRGATSKLLIGFCLMLPRTVYEKLGGMDESLFLGNDDLDLSWRLREHNLKLVVASDAFVFHEGQKSFKTEPSPVVTRLVQESTDALYRKLVRHYGNPEKVPSSTELWGMGWFTPSAAAIADALNSDRESQLNENTISTGTLPESNISVTPSDDNCIPSKARMETWENILHVICVSSPDPGNSELLIDRLKRTLASLPEEPETSFLVLSPSGALPSLDSLEVAQEIRQRLNLLETPKGQGERQALAMAARLSDRNTLLLCDSGVEFSPLFNFAFPRALPELRGPMPLTVMETPGSKPPAAALGTSAIVIGCKELQRISGIARNDDEWIKSCKNLLTTDRPLPNLPALAWREKPASGGNDSIAHASLSEATSKTVLDSYPEGIRPLAAQAKRLAFLGESAGGIPLEGDDLKGFDPSGRLVALGEEDLIIARVTPDLMAGLDSRLRNLRKKLNRLEKLILVWKPEIAGQEVPAGALRNALWLSGFLPISEKPYKGCGTSIDSGLEGLQLNARPRSAECLLDKKVSIIILAFNQLEYTRKCIESIRAFTRQTYELILVDNGSTDGTGEWFRTLPGAKVIQNSENLGVARGWNQALDIAEGEHLLIFNNDTIVTPGWLENLVRLVESDSTIAVAGPRSNNISGPQLIPGVSYRTESEIQKFGGDWARKHDLSAQEFPRITGFCMLIPRHAFEKIGFFDERFGKGNFEDDDWCTRARLLGMRLLIANDSFVHHFGSVSFRQESVDWQALMRENELKFRQKWAAGAEAAQHTFRHGNKGSDELNAGSAPSSSQPAAELQPTQLKAGWEAYTRKDMTTARQQFLFAQETHPSLPGPYNGLGVLCFHEGAHEEAAGLFMRALQLDPSDIDTAANLLDALLAASPGSSRSELASELGRRFPSNPAFAAAEAATSSLSAIDLLQLNASGENLIREGMMRRAEQVFQDILRQAPDHAYALNNMGLIAWYGGEAERAWDRFTAALVREPAFSDALVNAFDAALELDRLDLFLPYLESALKANPSAEEAREIARFLRQRGDEVRSVPNYACLEARRKTLREAETELEKGQIQTAIKLFFTVLDQEPKDSRALNGLGIVAYSRGDFSDAYSLFLNAVESDPADEDILLNLWDGALAAGKQHEVLPLMRTAIAIVPGLRELPERVHRFETAEAG